MPSEVPIVRPDVVRKVAALARLRVPDAELGAWSEQLARIVSYIDQLEQLSAGDGRVPRTFSTPLRADEPAVGCGRQALEENARLLHEHGVVPRVVASSSSAGAGAGAGAATARIDSER